MRVLVAIDGSESSAKALELAASIHWPADTEIRATTVVEPVQPVQYGAWVGTGQDAEENTGASAKAAHGIVENGQRLLTRTRAHVTPCILHGRPASEIVAQAEQFGADLISVGNRGHGVIASALLGSVSAEIADRATCPVLVARDTRLTRAVLAVDGSEFARAAEDFVALSPIFDNIAIEVTNVTDSMPVASALAIGHNPPVPEGTDVFAAADHRRVVMETVERLKAAGRSVAANLEAGPPAQELIHAAAAHQSELIVIGTHGRTGVKRAVLGSVAHNVLLHAKCSVLIVHHLNRESLVAA